MSHFYDNTEQDFLATFVHMTSVESSFYLNSFAAHFDFLVKDRKSGYERE